MLLGFGQSNKKISPLAPVLTHFSFFIAGESEILKFHDKNSNGYDINRQHMTAGRPYFRSTGRVYRVRNGYTVNMVCDIENLGE